MQRVLTAIVALMLLALPAAADNPQIDVDCDKGDTLAAGLERGKNFDQINIVFTGTCEEINTIDRDHVSIRGGDTDATVIGRFEVIGASNVTFGDFTIVGIASEPVAGNLAGINIRDGSSATVENMLVRDINPRGIRVIGSDATIRNTTVLRARGGAFNFRTASVFLGGEIVGNESVFGMSLTNTGLFSRFGDFTFNDNRFGLIVQVTSSLEHVEGTLSLDGNLIGMLIASQGGYAHGTQVSITNNPGLGLWIDELSNMTPLIGAPGGGPDLDVTNNPNIGVVIERVSTAQLVPGTLISDNGIGLLVENSQFRMDGATITDNGLDVTLRFGSKASFNGTANVVGQPIDCDGTILTRGSLSCGVASPVVTGPTAMGARSITGSDVPAGIIEGPAANALARLNDLQ